MRKNIIHILSYHYFSISSCSHIWVWLQVLHHEGCGAVVEEAWHPFQGGNFAWSDRSLIHLLLLPCGKHFSQQLNALWLTVDMYPCLLKLVGMAICFITNSYNRQALIRIVIKYSISLTYLDYLQSLEVIGWSRTVPIQFDQLVDASNFLIASVQADRRLENKLSK